MFAKISNVREVLPDFIVYGVWVIVPDHAVQEKYSAELTHVDRAIQLSYSSHPPPLHQNTAHAAPTSAAIAPKPPIGTSYAEIGSNGGG